MGSSSGNALESWIKGAMTKLSGVFGTKRNISQQTTTNGKDRSAFLESNQLQKHPFPVLTAFQRPFRRLFSRSVFLSAVLCCLYSHCWSRSLSAFNVSKEEGASIVCRGVFVPMLLFGSSTIETIGSKSCHEKHSCADERSIWILWSAAIIGYLFYYTIHEFTGKHHKSTTTKPTSSNGAGLSVSNSSSSLDMDLQVNSVDSEEFDEEVEDEEDDENELSKSLRTISATIHKLTKTKPVQPKGTLPMVSWYSNIVFTTGFDMVRSKET